jgi:serine/threonine-protein kinase
MRATERALDFLSYTAELKRGGVDTASCQVDETGTLYEPQLGPVSASELPVVSGGPGANEIAIKHRISRGGMGEVLLAEQTSLRRLVAVKRAAHANEDAAEHEIVVEGRIAGALEHPNIVPVHLLGATREGKPLLVMKRVEGRTWKSLLAERRDLIRDVDILMDVCRALHFAHSRGVIHRDVKPANVMVGSFGEVYLFDWGIAVGREDAGIRELPPPVTGAKIVGTPAYMAPEMAWPGEAIDERTDVYLVGAVLHELLTGKAPHDGTTIDEALHAAYLSATPKFDASVPEELAEICQKAMRRDPNERYRSAEEVRLALEQFREHAAARALLFESEERYARLKALPLDVDPRVLQRTFNECRFGFEQALRAWPESTRAKEGIERVLLAMIERELDAGHADSAELLLAELDAPPDALRARLVHLQKERARQAASTEALARLARDVDQTVAQRDRSRLLVLTALGWLAFTLGLWLLGKRGLHEGSELDFIAFFGAGIVGVTLFGWLVPRVRSTPASLSAFLALYMGMLGNALLFVTCFFLHVSLASTLSLSSVVLATSVAVSSSYDGRIWHGAGLSAVTALLIALWPDHALPLSGVGVFGALMFTSLWTPTGGLANEPSSKS